MLSSFFISVLLLTFSVVQSYNNNFPDHQLNIVSQPNEHFRVVNLLNKVKRRLEMTSNLIPYGWGPGGRRLGRGEKDRQKFLSCLLGVSDRMRRDDRGCNEVLSLVTNSDDFNHNDHRHSMA